jgi:hypothetical protein
MMAGGVEEADPKKLAASCENFKRGAKKLYEVGPMQGDMWLFELYHHLTDCAAALSRIPQGIASE